MSASDVPPPPLPPTGQLPPWPDLAAVQWIKDTEHLRLLSVFHYVVGGLAILFSSLFVFHIVFGAMMLYNAGPFASSQWHAESVPSLDPSPSSEGDATTSATPKPVDRRTHGHTTYGAQPPAFFGYMMMGLGSFAVLMGWTIGGLLIYSGRCLSRRTRRVFSMVVAGISCLQIPFGTILGVFTLVALQRPSILALYATSGGDGHPRA